MIELANAKKQLMVPVDTAFEYVTNMENYAAWFPGVSAIASKNTLPHGQVGKTYTEQLQLPDGNVELTIEVHQCETNRLFLTQGDLDTVLPQMTVRFEPINKTQCLIKVQYHSRSEELEIDSDFIVNLKKDLTERIQIGLENLEQILRQ